MNCVEIHDFGAKISNSIETAVRGRGIPRSGAKPILVKKLNKWEKFNRTISIAQRTPKRPRPDPDNENDNDSEGGGPAHSGPF